MFRPRSYTALTVQQQQLSEKLALPGHQSPLTAAEKVSSRTSTPPPDNDGYSGGKCKDVSTYQRLVKGRIWLRHNLAACISSERLHKACVSGMLLLLLMGVWALYAHMLHKVSVKVLGGCASAGSCKPTYRTCCMLLYSLHNNSRLPASSCHGANAAHAAATPTCCRHRCHGT